MMSARRHVEHDQSTYHARLIGIISSVFAEVPRFIYLR